MDNGSTLYIDQLGREWVFGSAPFPQEKRGHFVILPVLVHSMYPKVILDPTADYLFCTCSKCGVSIEQGLVAVELCQLKWIVCLVCESHLQTHYTISCTTILPMQMTALLAPLIAKSFENPACLVCDRPNCRNAECSRAESVVYSNRIEELLGLFYRQKLDLLSPIVNCCGVCRGELGKKRWQCKVCRLQYCCRSCKKKEHACEPLEFVYS